MSRRVGRFPPDSEVARRHERPHIMPDSEFVPSHQGYEAKFAQLCEEEFSRMEDDHAESRRRSSCM